MRWLSSCLSQRNCGTCWIAYSDLHLSLKPLLSVSAGNVRDFQPACIAPWERVLFLVLCTVDPRVLSSFERNLPVAVISYLWTVLRRDLCFHSCCLSTFVQLGLGVVAGSPSPIVHLVDVFQNNWEIVVRGTDRRLWSHHIAPQSISSPLRWWCRQPQTVFQQSIYVLSYQQCHLSVFVLFSRRYLVHNTWLPLLNVSETASFVVCSDDQILCVHINWVFRCEMNIEYIATSLLSCTNTSPRNNGGSPVFCLTIDSCLKHETVTCILHRLNVLSKPKIVFPLLHRFLMSLICSSLKRMILGVLYELCPTNLTKGSFEATRLCRWVIWSAILVLYSSPFLVSFHPFFSYHESVLVCWELLVLRVLVPIGCIPS